jgi:ribosomal protein S18 acetylase RimI-like enzyme
MDVRIRRCLPFELDVLVTIDRETYNDTFRSMNTVETMNRYLDEAFDPARLAAELSNPASEFWFLFLGEELAGYMKVNDAPAQTDLNDPDSLELERIYVRRADKGKGLGKALMEHAIRLARERKRASVWLGVWEKNVEAIGFYERMGFRKTGRHTFRMGDELQFDLVMTLSLTARPVPVTDGPLPS